MKFRLAYRLLFLVCFQLISSFVFSQTIGGTRPIDDYDGDGIINSVDLDDDNDGVPDSEEYCSSSITLPATNTTAGITEQAVPAGWVISNSSPDIATTAYSIYGSWISTCTGTVPKPPNGHNSWVNFYSNTQEAFKTTLSGLVVGKTYILKVYYAKFGATAALGKITTKLGTTIIDDYRPSAGCGWETRYISFTATATAQDLQFQNTGLASPMQNASVSVSSDALYEVCDTDNDGLPNQFDLDSDGDGCPDAKEAGVTGTLRNGDMKNGANGGVVTTSVSTAGAISGLANSYGTNGLADGVETVAESGVINYTSTYANYALSSAANICSGLDTDGDGVVDLTDLDDDNDGILDEVETAWCKPLTASTIIPVGKTYGVTAASFGSYLPAVTAGLDATTCMSPGQVTTLTYEFGKTVNNPIIGFYGVDYAKEEWFDLNDNPVKLRILDASVPTSVSNNILTLSTSPIAGANTAATSAMGRVQVYGNVTGLKVKHTWLLTSQNCDNHGFSFLEPTECLGGPNPDTDGDGVINSLDLDSDGDGCFDAIEAGVLSSTSTGKVIGTYGSNGFANSIETVADNGIYNSVYSYSYAIYNKVNACLDSDGDGVKDLFDLDDDNDGILDTIEQSTCANAPTYTFSNIDGSATGALAYNAAFPAWMRHSFTESEGGFKFTFDAPVSDIAFEFASIYQDDRVGDFSVKLADGTVLNAIDFDLSTTYGPTASIWTPQPNNVNNFTGNFSKFTGAPFNTGTPYFKTTNLTSGTAQSWGIVRLKNIAGANTVGIAEVSFKIIGGSATSGTGGLAIYNSCLSYLDTDNDGIPNTLDLDADGDECPDAKEANIQTSLSSGAIKNGTIGSLTTTTVANAIAGTTGNYGANGFANVLETATESGNYSGSYTYGNATNRLINGCLDSDGDNVTDAFDLDDDNDGILDTIEMTNCNSSVLITPSAATSSPVYGGNTADRTIDGSGFTGTGLAALATAPATLNDAWLLKEPFTSGFIEYTLPVSSNIGGVVLWAPDAYNYGGGDGPPKDFTVEITYNNGQVFTTGVYTTAQPNGSGDNPGAQVFNFPITFTNVTKVKLNILNGWYDINNNSLNQVSTDGLTVHAAYNMFLGEFRVLCGAVDIDTDNDGIPNRLDLDSDGDGCPDAKEAAVYGVLNAGSVKNGANGTVNSTTTISNAIAGTAGNYGANGFANYLETATESGIYSGTLNYSNAIYNAINGCTDTDMDGVSDIIDLDDDNDGVTDCEEGISIPLDFSAPVVFTNRNIDDSGVGTFSSSQPIGGGQIAGSPQGDANGNVGVAVSAGVGVRTSYAVNFSVPTSIIIRNNTKILSGYVTNDEYFDFSANGLPIVLNDPALELQIFNGSAWVDVPVNYSATTIRWRAKTGSFVPGAGFFAFTVGNANSFQFIHYNNTGATQNGTTLNISRNCIDRDTDNDGIPNRLDLDSDGDGCTDALETGVSGTLNSGTIKNGLNGVVKSTTNSVPNSIAAGPYGANGLADGVETSIDGGLVNYFSKYANSALNKSLSQCADTDGDAVPDMNDLDDDNDGVLDETEFKCETPLDAVAPTTSGALATYQDNKALFKTIAGTTAKVATNLYNTPIDVVQLSGTSAASITLFDAYLNLKFLVADLDQSESITIKAYDYQNNLIQLNANNIVEKGSYVNITYPTGASMMLSAVGGSSYDATTSNISNTLLSISNIAKRIEFSKTAGANNSWVGLFSGCVGQDTDNDGIPNHLDLDSDGDGCSDAIEAKSSVIATSTSVYPTGADANNNGLLNDYESATAGVVNYLSTYDPFATSANLAACKDTDGDGISDNIDLDDDNDGILDAIESPDCFYTANEWKYGARSDINVTSPLTMVSPQNNPQKLVDGFNYGTSYDVRFAATAGAVNAVGTGVEVYKFNMNIPVKLSKVYLGYATTSTQFAASTVLSLRGSNDGVNWTNLSGTSGTPGVTYDATIDANSATETSTISPYPATTLYSKNANIFSVTQNAAKYQYYDIYWLSGGAISLNGYANEVYFDVATDYIPSAHPKITCINDTDGDGVLNHQDLDSDGDGCPDAKEAGITATLTSALVTNLSGATIASGTSTSTIQNAIVAGTGTPTFGNNGFVNTLETASESGIYNGTYNYTYANNKSVSTCLDSDGDGVSDVNDLDDDNDGILDIVECPVPGVTPLLSRFDIASGATKTLNMIGFPEELWVDVWSIDNNFNLTVNGVNITNVSELNFHPTGSNNMYSVPFTDVVRSDGSPIYPANSVWFYPKGAQYPLIRVKVNKNGYSKIYGYDFVNGTGNYQELVLVNADYQKVPINLSGNNTIVFGQDNTWAPSNLNAEFNTYSSVGTCDTDGDGTPNQLDLDSDNDGCSDALEAKTTSNNAANFIFDNTNNFGTNGFVNSLEKVTDNGIYSGYYTYDLAINGLVKACKDSDGDGIPDVFDLDDDNDGILDAIESPTCYYSLKELTIPASISSDLLPYNTTATYALTNAIDGVIATFSAFNDGQYLANKEIIKLTANGYISIASLTLDLDFREISKDAASTFLFQGSEDNVIWENLSSSPIASSSYVAPLVLTNSLQPTKQYKYFRLYGVAGTSNFGGIAEATFNLTNTNRSSTFPKLNCSNDIDGDGIANHLDLDSDGDACPDAKEAGVVGTLTTGNVVNLANPNAAAGTATSTTNNVANAIASGTYSANGFADAIETATESGNYTGTYNYDFAISKTFNACADTDSDGIPDLVDIDDDNDGILDAVESPTCFYNTVEMSKPTSISTDLLPYSTTVIGNAIDADLSSYSAFAPNQNWVGKSLFNLTANAQIPISGINFSLVNWALSNPSNTAGNTFKLQGSNDNNVWIDLSTAISSAATTGIVNIPNTLAISSKFKYYQIVGVAGASYYAGVKDINFVIASSYVQSQYTKPTCLTGRNDADLIPNHLDLDSDGDGCSDALEAGTTSSTTANYKFTSTNNVTDFGANGFYNSLEKTTAESNLYKGIYTYVYATDNTINTCIDFDGDGAPDLFDLDDDNDGILDAIESPTCFYTLAQLSKPIAVSTELAPYSTTVITSAIDSDLTSYSAFAPSISWVNKEIFKFIAQAYVAISGITFNLVNWPLSSDVNQTFKLQGSGDNMNWTDLSAASSSTTNSATYAISNTLALTSKFKYFRLIGVAGNTHYGGVTDVNFNLSNTTNLSTNPMTTCTTSDIDGDGIPNYQDLDSDGDACTDAKESGVIGTLSSGNVKNGTGGAVTSTVTNANAIAGTLGNYGSNGFANGVESATESGIYSGTYTYYYAIDNKINTCSDTDGDGVLDYLDIDDDNDGVLDYVEQTCTSASMSKTNITLSSAVNWTFQNAPTGLAALLDGSLIQQMYPTDGAIVNKTVFQFNFLTPKVLNLIELANVANQIPFVAGGTYKIQGSSDGTNWNDIVSSQVVANTAPILATSNSIKFDMPNNWKPYISYRIYAISMTGQANWSTEVYFREVTCVDIDTDGDGILNKFDLDSDGDACPDAVEAGTAPIGTTAFGSVSFFNPGTTGSNGFMNSLETATESGIYSGTYKYVRAISSAISACLDTDGDGVSNIDDIDDDNDGITDLKELNCTITNSTDGTCTAALKAAGTYGIFTHCSGWNAFDFDPSPSVLDRADFDYMGVSGTDPYFDLQGSYAGPNIIGKMVKSFATTAGLSYTFEVELISVFGDDPTTGSKPYLRAIDASTGVILGTTYLNGSGIRTVSFTGIGSTTLITLGYDIRLGNIGSLFWKGGKMTQNGEAYQICSLQDTDNDGVPNQLDLDSDGDGCSDAVEAGTVYISTSGVSSSAKLTTSVIPAPYGANGFANGLETASESGAYTGTYTYDYAIDATISGCKDTDGDGVSDIIDLDDDNDGVLDTIEYSCSVIVVNKTGAIITKPSTINYNFNGNTIANLIDGVDNNVYVIYGPSGTLNGPWLNFEFPSPKVLTYLEIGHYVNQTLFTTTSTYKIEGSSNNTNWTDVSGTLTYNNNATSTSGGLSNYNSNIANFPNNKTAYKYYRIVGINASSGGTWATEIYFKELVCGIPDLDGDGIPNSLDLDSDGDGCPDAKESGVNGTLSSGSVKNGSGGAVTSTTTIANAIAAGPYGNNGLANGVETSTESGVVTYTSTYTNNALVKDLVAPTISVQPLNRTVFVGSAIVLTTTAGTPPANKTLTYQWYKAGVAVTGATSATYTITSSATTANVDDYYCAVGFVNSCLTTNTNTINVTVLSNPVGLTACQDANAPLSVTKTGTNSVTYQWKKAGVSLVNGANIAGATTSSLTLTNLALADAGAYTLVATDANGAVITSLAGTITITNNTKYVLPTSYSTCATTSTINLSSSVLTSTAGATSTKWQRSLDGGNTWFDITSSLDAGVTYTNFSTATLGITAATTTASATLNGYQYRIATANTTCTNYSNVETITINSAPAITTQPSNSVLCTVYATSFTTVATGSNLLYQWQTRPAGNGSWTNITGSNASSLDAGVVYSNYATATLNLSASPAAENNNQYQVVVSNSCGTVTSTTAVLNPTVATPTISGGNVSVCEGTAVSLTASSSTASPTYQWYLSGSAIGGATNATYNPTASGSYSVITNATGYCSSGTASATVTINPLPTVTIAQGAVLTLTSGGGIDLTATASPTATYSYTWYNNTTSVSGPSSSNVYSVATAGSYTVKATNTNTNCFAISAASVITVLPSPSVNGSSSICSGGSVAMSFALATGQTIQWESSTDGTNWTAINNATNANYTATPTNLTNASITIYYHAVVNGAAPTGTTNAIVVTVNPLPTANISNSASGTTLCAGTEAILTASSGATSATYQWYNNNSIITGATASTYTATASGNYSFIVTDGTTSCAASSITSTVTVVSPPAAPNLTATSKIICINTTADLTVYQPIALTGISYEWHSAANTLSSTLVANPTTVGTAGTYYLYAKNNSAACYSSPSVGFDLSIQSVGSATLTSASSPTYTVGDITIALNASTSNPTYSLRWYSSLTGGVALSSPVLPSSLYAGTTNYYVEQYDGNESFCTSNPRQLAIVTVKPLAPSITNITYCQNATAVALTATPAIGGTLNWYGTAATGGTSTTTATIPATGTATNTSYYVSQTVNGVESERATLTVSINAAPNSPSVISGTFSVISTNSYTYSVTAVANTTYQWTLPSFMSGSSSSNSITALVNAAGSDYINVIAVNANGCSSPASVSSVISAAQFVAPPPTITNSAYTIVDPAIPSNTSSQVTGASGATLNFYTSNAVGASSTSAQSMPTTVGVYTYYVSQTINGVESVLVPYTVTIKPVQPIVADITYCQNEVVAQLTATGTALKWYTVSTGGTSSSTATPSTGTATNTTYYVTQTVNGVESDRTALLVTINPTPATPSPITGSTTTATNSSELYSVINDVTATSYVWTLPNTWFGISTINDITATIGLSAGQITVKALNGNCASPAATLTVDILNVTNPPLTTDVIFVTGSTPSNILTNTTALITGAASSTLNFYTSNAAGTASTTTQPTPTEPGVYTYYVSQTSSIGVESILVPYTITVKPIAPAINTNAGIVGNTINYCKGATASPLTATVSNGGVLKWYTEAIGGFPSSIIPTVFTSVVGTTNYYISQIVNGVESDRALIVVTVNDLPSAITATASQPTCSITSGTILVTSPLGTGFTYSVDGSSYTATTLFNTLPSGSYLVTAKNANGCISNPTTVNINPAVIPPLTPLTSTVQPTCSVRTGTINIISTGLSSDSYSIDGGLSYQSSKIFTSVAPGTYSVTTLNASGCVSGATTAVINAAPPIPSQPTISAIPSGVICEGTSVTMTSSVSSGNQWYKDGVLIAGAINQTYSPNVSGNYTVIVTNASGCISLVSAAENITFNNLPTPIIAEGATLAFNNCTTTTITLTASNTSSSTGNTYQWYLNGNSINVSGTSAAYNANQAGSYSVVITNNGCSATSSISKLISAPSVNAANTAFCSGGNSIISGVNNGFVNPVYQWQISSDNGLTWANASGVSTNLNYTSTQSGKYQLQVTDGGLTSTSCPIIVTVFTNPTASITASPSAAVCAGSTISLAANATSGTAPYTYQWSLASSNDIANATASAYIAGTPGSYEVKVADANGCTVIAAPSTINFNSVPSAPTVVITNPTCSVTTGTISITAPLGAGYTYSIDGVNYTNTTGLFTGVAPGATYNVTAKSTSGCISLATTATIAAALVLPAQPGVISGPTSVAANSLNTYSVSPVAGATSYTWTIPGVWTGVSITNSITIKVDASSGSISVSANSATCTGPARSLAITAISTVPDVNVTNINVPVRGSLTTNDLVPNGTTYGQPGNNPANPTGATITVNADGSYTFTSTTPGKYIYYVPVCAPGQSSNCPLTPLAITVLDPAASDNKPVVNYDIVITQINTATTVNILSNDKSGNNGTSLNPSSVTVPVQPAHGSVVVNADGTLTYTPFSNYVGTDSVIYSVCDNSPTPICQTSVVYFTISPVAVSKTLAADDFASVGGSSNGTTATGNVLTNDKNTAGASLTASLVTGPSASQGTLVFNADGSYVFTPAAGFSGPVDIVYTACTGATPPVCATATLHILVNIITVDTDGDGVPDNIDLDNDNDGILDSVEFAACTPSSSTCDTDGDGIPNNLDLDSDGDGINDAIESGGIDLDGDGKVDGGVDASGVPLSANGGLTPADADGDGKKNPYDVDSDGDGILDSVEKGAGLIPVDTDGDGTPDYLDTDSDGDGILDSIEKGAGSTPVDTDGDGVPDYLDTDSDGDGIPDSIEKGTGATPVDTDGDGVPDYKDLDSDNDGIPDSIEKGAGSTPVDTDGDGVPDYKDLDSDNDGIPDSIEKGSGATPVDTDGDGVPDYQDLDSDGDGILDSIEKGTGASPVDTDGDGVPDFQDLDSDGDGILDSIEKGTGATPVDTDGDGVPDYQDLDSDNDGIPDSIEKGSGATPVDTDGDGVPDYKDLDSDNDGIPDSIEKGSGSTLVDTDGDGVPDYKDLDSDNDGILDSIEKGSGSSPVDTDGDGVPDYKDLDSDNDGIPDSIEKGSGSTPVDTDGDGVPDYKDLDSDNDGIPDSIEKGSGSTPVDTDGDGVPDYKDLDSDNDGILDSIEKGAGSTPVDTDGDGVPDYQDLDSDNDGILDSIEKGSGSTLVDTDGDGVPDYKDLDSDNDGILDSIEKGSGSTPVDTDGDGIPDYKDLDSDNDGILDSIEKGSGATPVDTDGDGVPDFQDLDSDNDGILDSIEKGSGATPVDTDGDGVPDYKDLDSDNDGIPDSIEKGTGSKPVDTDGDGVPDYLDLDSDNDGIPDSIEKGAGSTPVDTDGDGVLDFQDLDSDNDGILDSIEKGSGSTPVDTDGDGVPDYKDLDSDNDGILDSIEKGSGSTPVDTDGDGVPDYKDLDSDNDGIPDSIEKGSGSTPVDTDGDGIPDYLDLDSDNDGILDSIEKGADGNTPVDTDGDGVPDYKDLDSDNDGIPDSIEKGADGNKPVDTDGDGVPDYRDLDSDNDGIPDSIEKGSNGNKPVDTDGDGIPDYLDLDSDNDGIPDSIEKGSDGNKPVDTDGDGVSDYRDLDSDNDGIPDSIEKGADGNKPVDTDGDGTPDYRDLDSDNDGIPDTIEKGADGNKPVDTDGDGIPDYRDLDSDNDGILDSIEKGADGNKPVDTDGDGIPDYRDLDSDADGVTDADEKRDGTNPIDPCSLKLQSQTMQPSDAWMKADCNGDKVPNGEVLIVTKYVSKPVVQVDGSMQIKYTVALRNPRPDSVKIITIKDDLTKVFLSPINFTVTGTKSTGSLIKTSTYDGRGTIDLVTNLSSIAGYGADSVMIEVTIIPNGFSGDIDNIADVEATTKWGAVKRQSIDTVRSAGRLTGSGVANRFTIPKEKIIIPEAFSPNGDGFNDYFEIIHPSSTTISLAVYNRWGNVVYMNADYQNDWRGKGKGNFLGQELPEGTYYYIINATEKFTKKVSNFAGFLNLKR